MGEDMLSVKDKADEAKIKNLFPHVPSTSILKHLSLYPRRNDRVLLIANRYIDWHRKGDKYAAIESNGTHSKGNIASNAFTQNDDTNPGSDSKNSNKRKRSLDTYQTNISKSSQSYLSSNTGDVNDGHNRHAKNAKTDFKDKSIFFY